MNKRGVYFFALDAIISSIIILITVYFILSLRAHSPESLQSYTQSEDFTDFLMQTEIRDFSGNYTRSLVEDGNITNTRRTLFEQIAEFQFYNKTGLTWRFLDEISNSSLLSQQGLAYWFNEEMVFNRSEGRLPGADLVLSSKKISFVRINRSVIYGPHLVEVWIWY